MAMACQTMAEGAPDLAGPFLDSMFLVIIDAHSKWPEVVEMRSTTAHKTITELRSCFPVMVYLFKWLLTMGPS